MTAESLYDYFEQCIAHLPPQARLALVLDPLPPPHRRGPGTGRTGDVPGPGQRVLDQLAVMLPEEFGGVRVEVGRRG